MKKKPVSHFWTVWHRCRGRCGSVIHRSKQYCKWCSKRRKRGKVPLRIITTRDEDLR